MLDLSARGPQLVDEAFRSSGIGTPLLLRVVRRPGVQQHGGAVLHDPASDARTDGDPATGAGHQDDSSLQRPRRRHGRAFNLRLLLVARLRVRGEACSEAAALRGRGRRDHREDAARELEAGEKPSALHGRQDSIAAEERVSGQPQCGPVDDGQPPPDRDGDRPGVPGTLIATAAVIHPMPLRRKFYDYP